MQLLWKMYGRLLELMQEHAQMEERRYGDAIHEAGAVKARRSARHATSDWMDFEKQRGISITSTALVFENKGFQITLLDTPGHQDFGEDTYRTLAAADNAVMLVDVGKGLEPQTRKLFEVCRMRKLPIFTFINNMDRPALEPLKLIDQIEKEFNLPTYPVNWPIGSGDRFVGVYYRPRNEVHLFEKGKNHGSPGASDLLSTRGMSPYFPVFQSTFTSIFTSTPTFTFTFNDFSSADERLTIFSSANERFTIFHLRMNA